MSHGNLLNVLRCANTRRVMKEALEAGWEWVGYTKGGHVEIRWPATGQLLHCATTPSDPNSWKAFAKNIRQVSGVETHRKGNRKRSRKNPLAPDREVEVARARHARELERRRAEEQRRRHEALRREASWRRAAAEERRRREIEQLMRPGR